MITGTGLAGPLLQPFLNLSERGDPLTVGHGGFRVPVLIMEGGDEGLNAPRDEGPQTRPALNQSPQGEPPDRVTDGVP
ncbi:MAG TPA: hypothetical protein VHZ03_48275 [Trebonia sp.]|nr:hypothetical protein [Trebonia sp.]